MQETFKRCLSLTSLPSGLANWNTSKVTNMKMFSTVQAVTDETVLTDISAIANWNVSKNTNGYDWLSWSKVTSIILPHWNTSSLTNAANLFHCCYYLTTLDMSYWNMSKVTSNNWFLQNCSKLFKFEYAICFR